VKLITFNLACDHRNRPEDNYGNTFWAIQFR